MPGFLLCAKSNWTVYRELSDSVQTVNCHPKSRSFMVTILKINSNTEQKLNASQNAVRRLAPITRIAQSLSEPLTSLSKVVYVTAHLRFVKAGAGCGFLFPVQQIKCV